MELTQTAVANEIENRVADLPASARLRVYDILLGQVDLQYLLSHASPDTLIRAYEEVTGEKLTQGTPVAGEPCFHVTTKGDDKNGR